MARDALMRNESCGVHFREEYQTGEGEALRDDKNFTFVANWEFTGVDKKPEMHKDPLKYEYIEVKTRNYKE
jgi:succinate dehydrogenase / fumarate reductase flavoprotein subunit